MSAESRTCKKCDHDCHCNWDQCDCGCDVCDCGTTKNVEEIPSSFLSLTT
jgi:hypothetical protein